MICQILPDYVQSWMAGDWARSSVSLFPPHVVLSRAPLAERKPGFPLLQGFPTVRKLTVFLPWQNSPSFCVSQVRKAGRQLSD